MAVANHERTTGARERRAKSCPISGEIRLSPVHCEEEGGGGYEISGREKGEGDSGVS